MQSDSNKNNLSDHWIRYGSGHGFLFYATRSEITQYLFDFFSGSSDNVYVCGTDFVQLENSKYYKQVPFFYPLEQIMECLVQHQKSINFYIGMGRLTSRSSSMLSCDSNMALCGLIILQIHYAVNNKTKQMAPSRICITNKIVHESTHEIIEHVEYYKIFQQLKRKIKKQLKYKTVFRGSQKIDNMCHMSEGIFECWKAGEIFEHDPVIDNDCVSSRLLIDAETTESKPENGRY